jgi:heme exporter protein B
MDLSIQSIPAFLIMLMLGTIGLSSVSTMTAAIVSQADRKGAVFSVLSIPLFIPLILLLSRITRSAFVEGSLNGFQSDVFALIGFCGVTITTGVLLFDFIWDE